jgi:glycerate 2-kinase
MRALYKSYFPISTYLLVDVRSAANVWQCKGEHDVILMILPDVSQQKIRNIFDAALLAVDPYKAVHLHRDYLLSVYEGDKPEKLLFVSFGKAAAPMARALADDCGDLITQGIVITKYGHAGQHCFAGNIAVYEAGHPVPDESGVRAAREAVKLLRRADDSTLIVFLISGGGSALLLCPCEGISLAEKQEATGLLLKAGADIRELNTVRKHISAIKGGRLAEIARRSKVISLILSDVIGDPLDVIASGPTAPDTSTYADALEVIQKYDLAARMPSSVIGILTRGMQGKVPETPKKDARFFSRVHNMIIGSNVLALEAAKKAAERSGFKATIIATDLHGEASLVAKYLAREALEQRKMLRPGEKACLIAGGETTVTVKGNGKGGRNTELALAFGMAIRDVPGITFLSAGTDGTDGPTDAAGAIVSGDMIAKASALGMEHQDYLFRNDSYTFFQSIDGLIMTGPTGTNVMDIQLILLEN